MTRPAGSGPKKGYKFENPAVLPPTGSGPWKMSCVATLVEADSGQPVEGEPVKIFLNGRLLTTVYTEEGKISYDVEVAEPGTYDIEFEAYDTAGKRVAFSRKPIVKKPEDKKDEDPFLFVWPIRMNGYYLVTVQVKVNERTVLKVMGVEREHEHVHTTHKKVEVQFFHPNEPAPRKVETERGIATTKFDIPATPVRITILGGGQSESVLLRP